MSSATRSTHPAPAADAAAAPGWRPRIATGVLVLADGEVIDGFGVGATGSAVGEGCFNTAMTGYEGIPTAPPHAAPIGPFTLPHVGVLGANDEGIAVGNPAAS